MPSWILTSMKSPLLKKRINIQCKCKRQKSNENDRIKYGTCRCDSYSMNYKLGFVIHNYLIQYIVDAGSYIIREDLPDLERHAQIIKDYIEADSWDTLSKDRKVKSAYLKKERDFKKTMKFLVDNWGGFWW